MIINGRMAMGSVETTFSTILLSFNRLIHEDPLLLTKSEELARKLIKTRWALKKYSDEILNNLKEEGSISWKKLIYEMISYEYDPPLQYRLTPEQQEELYLKLNELMAQLEMVLPKDK